MMEKDRDLAWASHCQRCDADLTSTAHTMSVFNTDVICLACKEDEKDAPGYAEAKRIEEEAVGARNYNYPGVGLSAEDEVFLRERREKRRQA